MQTSTPPIVWALEHLSALGWPAILYAIWRISRFLTQVEARAVVAEGHITTLATNHFPHMEASLKNQDGLMKSMDESLKTLAENQVRRSRKKEK